MFQLFPILAATTAPAGGVGGTTQLLGSLIPFIIIIPLMYFFLIRPQKKKQKEEQKMRNSVRVGDEITTIGGIRGRILNIKEDMFVIETGADRTKMTVMKWALQSVHTVHEDPVDDDDDDDI